MSTNHASSGVVRFLHTSDWQLGMTRHYLAGEAQARFSGDRIEGIRRIGAVARDCGAEFVVVAGDVFEHANLPRADVLRALGAMGEVGLPIYLLPGNHDPLDASSIYRSDDFVAHKPEAVHVLDVAGAVPVRDGVELVASPWLGKHPESDPVAAVLDDLVADGTTRIVVGHGMLEGVTYFGDEQSAEIRRAPLDAALTDGRVHYVALGDRHIRWADPGGAAIHYSGTHESTSFRETSRGQVLEVVLSDGRATVSDHEVGRWLHLDVQRAVNSDAELAELDGFLSGLPGKEYTIIRHTLQGSLSLRQSAALDELLDRHGAVFASLRPWERHSQMVVVPDEAEFDDLPIAPHLRAALDQLQLASADGDDVAASALKLLYRLTRGTTR